MGLVPDGGTRLDGDGWIVQVGVCKDLVIHIRPTWTRAETCVVDTVEIPSVHCSSRE